MRMSDWSSDVCSSDLCRSATVRFICRQAIARCRTLRQPTGSRSKSANSSRQPETRGTLLMAHEALLAALDQRRESARRMGGEAKLAKRRERRSEEHTSELQSLMRSPYAVFSLKKKNKETRVKESNKSE